MEPAPFWSESGRSPHSRLVPAALVHIDSPGCGPQPRPLILISPAPCMALVGTLVRSQQVGCVQCGTSFDFFMSGGQTCVTFCSKVLAPSSGGQSAVAVACILEGLFDQYPTTGSGIFIELPMASGDSYKCWPHPRLREELLYRELYFSFVAGFPSLV